MNATECLMLITKVGHGMEYDIFKLKFPYGIHIGDRSLENSHNSFLADTLFSALCIEAIKEGKETFERLLQYAKAGELLISDAFPFLGDELFLPKPYIRIKDNSDGTSTLKKQYKKMNYVAMSKWDEYLAGSLNPNDEIALEKKIGWYKTETHCAIRGLDETKPYRIGSYVFSDQAGLYIIYGYDNEDAKDLFYNLLDKLSFSGIGGKRSSGLGRFEIYTGKMSEDIKNRLETGNEAFISLSVSLPKDDEISDVMPDARYMLEKRSGFVESVSYSDRYMRKKDLFMFAAGSFFTKKYTGDIYDVSAGGNHPVYRYGKPIFLGV